MQLMLWGSVVQRNLCDEARFGNSEQSPLKVVIENNQTIRSEQACIYHCFNNCISSALWWQTTKIRIC